MAIAIPRPEALVEGLGRRFEIMGASIKKWAAGAPIQAALDALETLMRTHGLGADDVDSLVVRLPDDRIHLVNDRDVPSLCAQHLLAVLLLDGAPRVGSSFPKRHGGLAWGRVAERGGGSAPPKAAPKPGAGVGVVRGNSASEP